MRGSRGGSPRTTSPHTCGWWWSIAAWGVPSMHREYQACIGVGIASNSVKQPKRRNVKHPHPQTCTPNHQPSNQPIHPSTHPTTNPSTRPLTLQPTHPPIHQPSHQPIHPSTHRPTHIATRNQAQAKRSESGTPLTGRVSHAAHRAEKYVRNTRSKYKSIKV